MTTTAEAVVWANATALAAVIGSEVSAVVVGVGVFVLWLVEGARHA